MQNSQSKLALICLHTPGVTLSLNKSWRSELSPHQNLKSGPPERRDPLEIEVVSVTEDDLPTVETPTTLNVSPLDSHSVDSQSENVPATPEEHQQAAASSPSMPVTKVQPFIHGEVTWRSTANQTPPSVDLLSSVSDQCFLTFTKTEDD